MKKRLSFTLFMAFFFLLGLVIGDLYYKDTDKSILSSIGFFNVSREEMISNPYEIKVNLKTETLNIKFLVSTNKQNVLNYLNKNREEIMKLSNDYFYTLGSEKIKEMGLENLTSGLSDYIQKSINKSINTIYITEIYPINQ